MTKRNDNNTNTINISQALDYSQDKLIQAIPKKKKTIDSELSKLPFWCYNNTLHLDDPNYTKKGCCLTHTVGLPVSPSTKQPMPLTPYQVEFFEAVQKHKKPKKGQSKLDSLRQPHKFHLLKGRQMGFSEVVLRLIQYHCYHDYAGSKVGIIAATNGSLAKKDLARLYQLFRKIQHEILDHKNNMITLTNGTVIEAFAASEEAMTGDTNYGCVFMDEAAKWDGTDDTALFNSIIPIVNANASDLFLVSTGKGRVKKFYEIYKNPGEYVKLEYNIWRTEGNLYTRAQILEMLASEADADQEYLCKFTSSKNAVFNEFTDKDENEESSWDYGIDDTDSAWE